MAVNLAELSFFRFIFLQHFRVDLNGLNQPNVFLAKDSLCYVFLNEFRIYFLFTPKTLGRVTRKMDGLLLQTVCNPKGPSLAKRKKKCRKVRTPTKRQTGTNVFILFWTKIRE